MSYAAIGLIITAIYIALFVVIGLRLTRAPIPELQLKLRKRISYSLIVPCICIFIFGMCSFGTLPTEGNAENLCDPDDGRSDDLCTVWLAETAYKGNGEVDWLLTYLNGYGQLVLEMQLWIVPVLAALYFLLRGNDGQGRAQTSTSSQQ